MIVTDLGNVLVVDIGPNLKPESARIVSLVDIDSDGAAENMYIIVKQYGLNHGIGLHDGKLYASSMTALYRWSYEDGQTTLSTDVETIISNMPSGGHKSRSFLFDHDGLLYLQVGSGGNIDVIPHSWEYKSVLRRFNTSTYSSFPINFDTGEALAHGIRNEVGLVFDKHGNLWGVENSGDNLDRHDLGGDIHKNNPSEELNYFPIELDSNGNLLSHHYGYPFCFTEFQLPEDVGQGRNSVWAWPMFMSDGIHTDEWCRNNTIPPVLSMQAHSAPLGITFLDSNKVLDSSCPMNGSFPDIYDGHAFVAYHGSWDRQPPTGYKIVRIPFNSNGTMIISEDLPFDFFFNGESSCAQWSSGFRPVDVKFDKCNRLLVTSDATGSVLLITYNGYKNDNISATIHSMDDDFCCDVVSDIRMVKHMPEIIVVCGCLLLAIVLCYKRVCEKSFKSSRQEYELVSLSNDSPTDDVTSL